MDGLKIIITVIYIIYIAIKGGEVIEGTMSEVSTQDPLEGKMVNHEKEVIRASVVGLVIGLGIIISKPAT